MRPDTHFTLDDLLDAFDAAWQQAAPRLEDFLPPRSGPEFHEALIGLVSIDLERRTKAGERARVEEYLSRFPELRADDSTLLELVLLERDLRKRHDPAFETKEYPARFPELASQLDELSLTVELVPTVQGNAKALTAGSSELDLRDHVLLDRVGRGGMGEVYRGRDPALGRNLAVKVLRPELRGHAEAERRFQQEARINGLLQHPSIVPVHNLGRLSDGRLYFTMKLVRGQTLADMLAERPNVAASLQLADSRGGPPNRNFTNLPPRYGLPELLGVFEKVCQALAYAHSRGVIHRDLKPSNIMVGAFGEVQVMDWGLAKVLRAGSVCDGEPAAETTIGMVFTTPSADATADEFSPTGVVGTPAYMAPEQALGTSEDLDERADVFGLGGILCIILTGEPPYTGAGRDEVLRKAAAGDLADAYTRLEARGADGELVQLAKVCLAADRNARPGSANVVAERVTAYLAGVQQRLHAAEVERAAALVRAEEAAKKAAAERRARRVLLALAAAVVLVLLGGIAGTTWGLWRAESFARKAAEEKDRAQKAEAATLAEYRTDVDDVIEQLIGSRPTLGPQENAYLDTKLKRWQSFAERTGDDERSRAIRAEGQFRVAQVRHKLGQAEEATTAYGEALLLQQKLADEFPTKPDYLHALARTHAGLGLALAIRSQPERAAEHYHQALAIGQNLADEFPTVAAYRQQMANTHNFLGNLLASQHQGDQATEQYGKALAILRQLTADDPSMPGYCNELAHVHNNLAGLLSGQGQGGKVEQHYREALAIQKKLADDFPTVPKYRQDLATTHSNLGSRLAGRMQREKAAEQFRKSLVLREKLVGEFRAVPAYRSDLASTHFNLGVLLSEQHEWAMADEQFDEARALQQKLADEFPARSVYRQTLALTFNARGNLLKSQKQWKKAAEQYRQAVAIQEELTTDYPALSVFQVDLGGSYCNYGNLYLDSGKPADSLVWYDKAIQTLTKVHQKDPRFAPPRQFLRNSYTGRALAREELEKHAEAVKDWTDVIDLISPQEQLPYRLRRARCRARAGQVDQTLAEVTELRKSLPVTESPWYDFACIYAVASDKKKEYAEQAMRCLRHAVQAGYTDVEHMVKDKDLDPLRGREDFRKLMQSLAKPGASEK
jgi:serine/threonine protein kinase